MSIANEHMRFAMIKAGIAIPVPFDHPQAITIDQAHEITHMPIADLEEIWFTTYGRFDAGGNPVDGDGNVAVDGADGGGVGVVTGGGGGADDVGDGAVGGEEGTGGGDGALPIAPVLSRAEVAAEEFRRYWYPWLAQEHFKMFRQQCEGRGINWRVRQAYPRLEEGRDGLQRVVSIVSIEFMRLRAQATGQHGGCKVDHLFDPDGRLMTSIAYVKRLVAASLAAVSGATFATYEGEAHWEEFFAWSGPAPLSGDGWRDVSEEEKLAKHAPDLKGPLCQKMPRVCLGRAAEAMGLRMAFPMECGGLYVEDEFPRGSGRPKPGGGGNKGGPAMRAVRGEEPEGEAGGDRGGGDAVGREVDEEEEMPTSLTSLKRSLLRRDDWDTARWEAAMAGAKRAAGSRGNETELCRRIWADANRRKAG